MIILILLYSLLEPINLKWIQKSIIMRITNYLLPNEIFKIIYIFKLHENTGTEWSNYPDL